MLNLISVISLVNLNRHKLIFCEMKIWMFIQWVPVHAVIWIFIACIIACDPQAQSRTSRIIVFH